MRLQFFRSALLHDADLARDIVEGIDTDLIRKEFDLTLWLWQQFLENDFCSLKEGAMVSALEAAAHNGADLNRLCYLADDHGQEIFHGNIGHLAADTHGDFFTYHELINAQAAMTDCSSALLILASILKRKTTKE